MTRLAAASQTTPIESAAAPTAMPGRRVSANMAPPATPIVASRTTVPYATRRVSPCRMRTPW